MNVLEAMGDERLFKPWFRDPVSWSAWRVFLKALFGLGLSEEDMALWSACTGRQDAPTGEFLEAWLVCGRRSGKSVVLAMLAAYLATVKDWTPYLSPGERGVVTILATDRAQAGVIFRYLRSMIVDVPAFGSLVTRETGDTVDLSNGVSIEVGTASFRSVRGRTIIAALLDEACFWRSESTVNPDVEILEAIRPAMATVPGALLLVASSPYSRKGIVWEAYKRNFGVAGARALVWQASTQVMNPTVPESFLAAAYERDPISAAAEFGAEWRSDIGAFVTREVVEACIETGCFERPRGSSGWRSHVAFLDAAGGSGSDSMTMAIAHLEGSVAVLDAVRERKPPFSPDDVVEEFSSLMKSYGVFRAESDKYGGDWIGEAFRKRNITVSPSAKPKGDIYREMLPLLNAGRCSLLDMPRLVKQLCDLERRVARSGKDSIDHPPGAHDDVANAAAGALVMAGSKNNSDYYRRRFEVLAS
jgi:hypothetical protein